jgi:predicted transcriptional regulator
MENDRQCILQLLAASPNGNMPETKLGLQYGRHFPRSTFDDALSELIDTGVVERVQPLHVKLK